MVDVTYYKAMYTTAWSIVHKCNRGMRSFSTTYRAEYNKISINLVLKKSCIESINYDCLSGKTTRCRCKLKA